MRRSSQVLAASVLAVLATTATLTTLLQGLWWLVEVGIVVLAVVVAGAGARRLARSPLVAVLAQTGALAVALTWLYARADALAGLLPTVASTGVLAELARAGVQLAQEVAPPAPSEPGLRLLVSAGIGAVAVLVDLLAVTLRQPAVAGLPLLAVYCVPAALAPSGLGWYWFVLAGAAYLLLVASDSGERVARWGRVLHGHGGQTAPLAATGRRVGALALAGAVVVPTLVPGLSENLLLGRGGAGGSGPGGRIEVVNPIYSLRDNLSASRDATVLSYRTTGAPQPLRIVTVDSFDGTTWEPTFGPVPRSNAASGTLPQPPGLSPAVETTPQRYEITIESLVQGWLPVPYPPTSVEVEGPWLYDDALNIIGDQVATSEGMTYEVEYLEVAPTPDQLLGAQALTPASEVVRAWGTAPPDLPEVVTETARQVAGQGSAYEQAVRLQQYFRSDGGFQYSTSAPDANQQNAIADFLTRRSGYCVHFASAMAVMARSLGIPARVAVGFLPGSQDGDGSWTVTVRDAHAWPELYFSGVGWVRFEPTPPTRSGTLPAWAAPPPSLTGEQTPAGGTVPDSVAAPDAGASTARDSTSPTGRSFAEVVAAVPWRVLAAVALVLAVASAPAAAAAVARHLRWRRAARGSRGPGGLAEAAWATLAERVRDLGLTFPASATPRQAEQRLAPGLSWQGRERLHRIARAVERGRYAPAPPPGDDGLAADVEVVVRDLGRDVGRRARWAAAAFPTSGVEHLRSALVDAGLALDRTERGVASRLRARVGRALGDRAGA